MNDALKKVPILASAICFCLGLACLTLVTAPADNVWYFYAHELLSGQRLYTDLHLIQQPIFIVFNAVGIKLFGDTFLGQRLIFVFVLLGYVYCAFSLTNKVKTQPLIRAIILTAFFMCAIHFEAYRFDDYHAFEGLLAMALTLVLWPGEYGLQQYLIRSCIAGLLTGLAILTRVNDGLAMLVAAILIVIIQDASCRRQRLLSLGLVTVMTFYATLAAIHETPSSWLHSTVLDAMGAKGGDGVLIAPFVLIKNSAHYILFDVDTRNWMLLACLLVVAGVFNLLQKAKNVSLDTLPVVGAACAILFLMRHFRGVELIILASASVFLAGVAFLLWRLALLLLHRDLSRLHQECLVLVPLSLYAAGAMSSGGWHYGLYFPMALTFIVAATCMEQRFWSSVGGTVVLVIATHLAISGFYYRLANPYSWHNYRAASLLEPRTLVRTEGIGYVPMDSHTRDFVLSICNIVKAPDAELLSLPFPYANFICGKEPWRGYVQTFFDTSKAQNIAQLVADLDFAPPRFVLYQRQLETLALHEQVFNHGAPLPHRRLDQFIMEKIESRQWTVVYEGGIAEQDQWLLMDTRAPVLNGTRIENAK